MKVPDYADQPMCPCGTGENQTVEHLLLQCRDVKSGILRALGFSLLSEVWRALGCPQVAYRIANALLGSGWLLEYRVAEAL